MKLSILICGSVLVGVCTGQLLLPSEIQNQKTVSAYCLRHDATMELRFAAAMNGNPVDKFLAVNGDVFTVSGSTNEAPCVYTGILSSNIAVSSTVITASTVVAGTNTCGARRFVDTAGEVSFKWTFQLRARFTGDRRTTVYLDRSYSITCRYNSATPDYITAETQVYGVDDSGTSTVVKPTSSLAVMRYTPSQGNFDLITRSINEHEPVKLRVITPLKSQPTRIANIDHTGSFVYQCDVTFGGTPITISYPIIANNGCPTGRAITPLTLLTNGFMYTGANVNTSSGEQFRTETDTFRLTDLFPGEDIRRFKSNYLVIGCYVGYCYSNPVESKCQDYCSYQNTRPRRSVEPESDRINIVININVNNTQSTTDANTGEDDSTMLIAVASSVSVLAFVAIVATVIVVCCCCRQRKRNDVKDWMSTSTNSRQHIPSFIQEEHMKPAKF